MSRKSVTFRSPVTESVYQSIGWDWQDVEPLIIDISPHIDPGPAIRKYKARRDRAKDPTIKRRQFTQTEQIMSGRRALINSALGSLEANGWVDKRKMGVVRQVKRRVQIHEGRCTGCGHPFGQATTHGPRLNKKIPPPRATVTDLHDWQRRRSS